MPFRLHLIRHAEGTHNPTHDTTILDPPLTATGVAQSEQLCRDFPYHDSVGLVIASPLKRTLQTAVVGFAKCIDGKYTNTGVQNGARFSLEADVQAHSARPCDTGSDISVLREEFLGLSWDILEEGLDPVFPAKTGAYAPDAEVLRERGRRMQRRLEGYFRELEGSERPDIVVVTHGGFMRFVAGVEKMCAGPARWRTLEVSTSTSFSCVD
ncbi:hypothetical protein ASPWEDRAFT_55015 [Aspergillus wentii DTO 134E9]|uniref:Histidine phosphatase superfamily n=1 Tax=Aspergillus wentii DTO 134E9 TaxID=1073089 RepID=A0A1L9R683_ASPWE|nr:uncharacterized protein ASPWEDRAFT_55015 [Aspergillus wentii DTO 134E9]OJJ30426.1 hypothetical protein ASPWEDRAFT_55015 [Aspergillus wentii DTO 134E9]